MFTPHQVSHVRCQVSGARCQVSRVTCQKSGVTHNFFLLLFLLFYKVLELVGRGSFINGASPVQFSWYVEVTTKIQAYFSHYAQRGVWAALKRTFSGFFSFFFPEYLEEHYFGWIIYQYRINNIILDRFLSQTSVVLRESQS